MWLLASSTDSSTTAQAHGILDKTIHHHLLLTAGEGYLDVEISVALPPVPAAKQRRLLDSDRDATITPPETARYLNRAIPPLATRFLLQVDGKSPPAFELYRPEIDLLDNLNIGSHPLVLKFFYSIRIPTDTRPDSLVEIEDRFWQDQDALWSVRIGSGKTPTPEGRSSLFPAGCRRTLQVLWKDLSNRHAAENKP